MLEIMLLVQTCENGSILRTIPVQVNSILIAMILVVTICREPTVSNSVKDNY